MQDRKTGENGPVLASQAETLNEETCKSISGNKTEKHFSQKHAIIHKLNCN
jgi:hypothetical protein